VFPDRAYPGSGLGLGAAPGAWMPGIGYGQPRPLDSRLRGTGLWADDLWLTVHDERTGKPRLARRHLGIVIGAGLLAEMIGSRAVGVSTDGLVYCLGDCAPREELAAELRGFMRAEREPRPVADWLGFMAASARDRGWEAPGRVAVRLVQAGYLTGAQGWFSRRSRWMPCDPSWACTARMRAAHPDDPYTTVLAALADAGDLRSVLGDAAVGGAALPGEPPDSGPEFRELMARMEVAVNSAVLSQRT
jgi:hypothetical protein